MAAGWCSPRRVERVACCTCTSASVLDRCRGGECTTISESYIGISEPVKASFYADKNLHAGVVDPHAAAEPGCDRSSGDRPQRAGTLCCLRSARFHRIQERS